MSQTYLTLKAAVAARAANPSGGFYGGAWYASVGPHMVLLHVYPKAGRAKFQSIVYGERATRDALDAALAKLPADAEVHADRCNWN